MNILAIDTALEACSVGIGRDASEALIQSEIIGRGHAERLIDMVRTAMAEAGLTFADLDRFAVTTGPGSFTGIRVGIAAIRGFALAMGAPAYGFSTLAVHAESARAIAGPSPVMAMLPAKGGEVFAQMFDADGTELMPAAVGPIGPFFEQAAQAGAAFAGAGAEVELLGRAPIHMQSSPDIAALLRLARRETALAEPPQPLYVKPPDAKPARPAIARI